MNEIMSFSNHANYINLASFIAVIIAFVFIQNKFEYNSYLFKKQIKPFSKQGIKVSNPYTKIEENLLNKSPLLHILVPIFILLCSGGVRIINVVCLLLAVVYIIMMFCLLKAAHYHAKGVLDILKRR